MVPIIKDHSGNPADVGNYRGITISPAISKLFEHVLKPIRRFTHFVGASIWIQEKLVDGPRASRPQPDRQLF